MLRVWGASAFSGMERRHSASVFVGLGEKRATDHESKGFRFDTSNLLVLQFYKSRGMVSTVPPCTMQQPRTSVERCKVVLLGDSASGAALSRMLPMIQEISRTPWLVAFGGNMGKALANSLQARRRATVNCRFRQRTILAACVSCYGTSFTRIFVLKSAA